MILLLYTDLEVQMAQCCSSKPEDTVGVNSFEDGS